LFTQISLNQLNLNSQEQDYLDFFNASSDYQEVTPVSMGNLLNVQTDGSIAITLPNNTYVEAIATIVDYESENNYTWAGEINNNGHLLIVSRDEGKMVLLSISENESYKYFEMNDNGGILAKESIPDTYPTCGNDDSHSTTNLTNKIDSFAKNNQAKASSFKDQWCDRTECPAKIRILGTYTPSGYGELLSQFGGNVDWLNSWFSAQAPLINFCLASSGVVNTTVEIVWKPSWVGGQQIIGLTIIDQFEWLLNNPNLIKAQRIDCDADLAFLIHPIMTWAESPSGGNFVPSGIGGIASIFNDKKFEIPSFDSSEAFSFINAFSVIRFSEVLTHEIGHNFGALHQWQTETDPFGDSALSCGHAWGNTVMRHDGGQLFRFSNPDYGNGNHGIPNYTADSPIWDKPAKNAQKIKATSCTVANYSQTTDWHVLISGPEYACTHNLKTFEAEIFAPPGSNGLAPYTYQWSWTSSGINQLGNIISTDPTVTIGNFACPFFFLHLTVTSADGLVSHAAVRIDTGTYCPYECEEGSSSFSNDNLAYRNIVQSEMEIQAPLLKISPNPSNGIFSLGLDISSTSGNGEILVLDLNGEIIKRLRLSNNENEKISKLEQDIDLSDNPSGCYIIRVMLDNKTYTSKIILIN